MKRRPIVLVFLALVSGIVLAGSINVHSLPGWPIVGILSSIGLFVSVSSSNHRVRTTAIVIGLGFFGVIIYGASYFDPGAVRTTPGTLDQVSGQVVTYPERTGNGIELTLKPESYRGKIKVFLTDKAGRKIDYGDELVISGGFQRPRSFEGFDYGEYLRKRGIWAVTYDGTIVSSDPGRGNPLTELGWQVREAISFRYRKLLPGHSEFLVALIFGERNLLEEGIRKAFTETGLAHLLAASGLHLGLVIAFNWWLLARLGLARGSIYLLTLPVVLLYLTAVGFKLPLLRASLIYLFGGAHFYLEKSGLILSNWYDRYQALATAGLLLVLYNPEGITTAGFQLSFGATFAIILFVKPIKKALPIKPDYLAGVLAASIAAQIGVAPVLAVHFQGIHPWAPLANLVAIPAVTGVLYLGLLILPLGYAPLIGSSLIHLEIWIIDGFRWLIGELTELPLVTVPLPDVTPFGLLSYFILIFWLKWKLNGLQENEESSLPKLSQR